MSNFVGGTRITRRDMLGGAAGAIALGLSRPLRAQGKGSLTFALSSYPINLKPWENFGTAASTVKLQSFRPLLSYGPDGKLRPEVAQSWSAEGTQAYVFKLRPNARFHDGSPVTADDVKATLEGIAGPKSTAYLRTDLAIIKAIETPDAATVRIELSSPSATFPYLMASFDAPIASRKSIEAGQPVGCGPYVVRGSERGAWIQLEAFADYYKPGMPRTPALRFVAYADENARVAALRSGDVDMIEYVPAIAMDDIQANPALKLDAVEGPCTYLVFNTQKGPFADPKVRAAVGFAINRAEVVKGAFGSRGAPLNGLPIPAGSPFYKANPAFDWSYDPARAKALLAEAGLQDGFQANFLTYSLSVHKDVAVVVQQQLAAVGIQATLNVVDWPTRIQLGNRGQFDLAVMANSGDSNDPDAIKMMYQGDLPASYYRSPGYNDPMVNALLEKGRSTLDVAERQAAYADLQKATFADPPIVGVCWRTQAYGERRQLSGFQNLPGFLTFYSGVMLEAVSV